MVNILPNSGETPHSGSDKTPAIIGKTIQEVLNDLQNYGELVNTYYEFYAIGGELIVAMETTLTEEKHAADLLLLPQLRGDNLNRMAAYNRLEQLISLVEKREAEKDDIMENMKLLENWFEEDWQEESMENHKKMWAFFNLYLKVRKDFLQLINRYKHEILTRKN